MGEAAEQLVAAILEDDGLDDYRPEPGHPLAEPRGHAAPVERQVGAAGTARHQRASASGNAGAVAASSAAPNNGSGSSLSSADAAKFDTVTPTSLIPVLGG